MLGGMFGNDGVTLRFTEAEGAMIAKLATVRARADAGNAAARRQMAQLRRQIASLEKQARRGVASAKRRLLVLVTSGILEPSQTFAMNGFVVGP